MTDVWPRFNPSGHYTPEFQLTVGNNSGNECHLIVQWSLSEADASLWRQPISLTVRPRFNWHTASDEHKKLAAAQSWETTVNLSREDARMLRDYLNLLLRCPNLREEDGNKAPHEHR